MMRPDAALRLNSVAAGLVNSATRRADVSETQRQLRDGRLRLLYVSPEGPMQPGVLEGLALQAMEERAAILERDGNMPPGNAMPGTCTDRILAMGPATSKATKSGFGSARRPAHSGVRA